MPFTLKIRERFLIASLLLTAVLLGTVWFLLDARFREWKNLDRRESLALSGRLLNLGLQQNKSNLSSQAVLLAERLSSALPGIGSLPLPGATYSFSKLCLSLSDKTHEPLFIVTNRTGRVLFDSYQLPENLLSIRQNRPLQLSACRKDLTAPPLSAATWPNVSKSLKGIPVEGIFVYGMAFIPKALTDQRLAFQSVTIPLIPFPGSPVEGTLILGYPLDTSFVGNLKELTGEDMAVEVGGRVLSSTLKKPSYGELEDILAPLLGRADGASSSAESRPLQARWGSDIYDVVLTPLRDPRGIRIGHYAMFQKRPTPETLVDALRRALLVAGFVGLVLALILGWLLSKPLTTALESIQKAADQTRPGSPGLAPVQGSDEVADLAGAFNKMWSRLSDQERVRHILGKKVGADVSRKILSSGDDLAVKGERRKCTVLFARLNGMRSPESEPSPDKWMVDLNKTLETLSAIVFENDGTLDHFGTGSLKAVWGAPVLLERQNESALRAAFEMRERTEEMSQKRMSQGQPPLSICIGLHTGIMVAGYLGTDQHSDYTVLGAEAEKAEMFARKAMPGQILVSGPIENWLSSNAAFKSIPSFPSDGAATAGTLYEAVAWEK